MNTPIVEQVLSCPRLPVLPPVAVELMELIRFADVEPAEVDALLKRDPVLADKILDAVNAPPFKRDEPCATIGQAVTYLGLNTIRSLAAGFSLMEVTGPYQAQLDLLAYWRRGLMSAAAARYIATTTRRCSPQDAFIAALMQDIGMLALQTALGETYDKVLSRANGNHRALPRCERTSLGTTHAEIGALLGRRWNLPGRLVDPILRHHFRRAGDTDHAAIVNTVVLGCQISYLCTEPMRQPDVARAGAMGRRFFGLSSQDARTLLAGAAGEARRLSAGFEAPEGGFIDAGAVMARANAALLAHHGRQLGRATPVTAPSAPPAAGDGLVGVGDRAGFDRVLASRFAQTLARGGCLSLIFIEIDELSALRDRHGAAVGETVMSALAPVLRGDGSPDRILSVYDRDTFALLVPGATRFESAKLAEHLRQTIGRQQVEVGGGFDPLCVTASVGVAALEPGIAPWLERPEPLRQLADEALHRARLAGRNCVRIFNPKAA